MNKPAWLADLHTIDQARAERWLAEVGEARFLTIAAAAAAHKRPRHRPAKDSTALVLFAAVHWMTHPGLNEGQAAAAAAEQFCKSGGQGSTFATTAFANASRGRVQRIMSEGLAVLSAGSFAAALQEAERLALSVRADVSGTPLRHVPPVPSASPARFRLSALPSSSIGLLARSLERMQTTHARALAGALPSPAKLAKLERTRHLLSALHGLVPDNTPMSRVSAVFSDMIAALRKTPEEER